jgi:hypothetical protein
MPHDDEENMCATQQQIITNFIILFCEISEYVKLVKIAMVQVLGLVEDEKLFNNLNFFNS